MNYKYITENNLENKQTYMYTEYSGTEFIEAYKLSRKEILRKHMLNMVGMKHNTYKELSDIRDIISNGDLTIDGNIKKEIDEYVKSFEVRKRLYVGYDENWKPVQKNYNVLENYLLFGEILVDTYDKTSNLKYLNCLLKITDSLCSVSSKMDEVQIYRLSEIVKSELYMVQEIQEKESFQNGTY